MAVDTIICFVNGFTVEEQTRRPATPTRRTRADRDQDFHAGLGLILAGIRATIRSGDPEPARGSGGRRSAEDREDARQILRRIDEAP